MQIRTKRLYVTWLFTVPDPDPELNTVPVVDLWSLASSQLFPIAFPIARLAMASPAKPKFKSVTKKRPLRTRRDSDDETAEVDKDDKQEESVLQVITHFMIQWNIKVLFKKMEKIF